MTPHQKALLDFLAFMCAYAFVGMIVWKLAPKIKRELEWRKVK